MERKGKGIVTAGIGKRTTAHLNLTVTLADVRRREADMKRGAAFDNSFASKSRSRMQS